MKFRADVEVTAPLFMGNSMLTIVPAKSSRFMQISHTVYKTSVRIEQTSVRIEQRMNQTFSNSTGCILKSGMRSFAARTAVFVFSKSSSSANR